MTNQEFKSRFCEQRNFLSDFHALRSRITYAKGLAATTRLLCAMCYVKIALYVMPLCTVDLMS